mmetsp:Transcript_103974/g.271493  ORF Transcript_103974/g.271493 Transcript_103974/m.271493 type:complete len:251 (+) Transcript_103974:67-819(+)
MPLDSRALMTPPLFALISVSVLALAGADCPKDCPAHCPTQEAVQSDFVRNQFEQSKFYGTFYEIAYHDSTQPTNFFVNARCQRSVKTPHPDGKNYRDLFSMRVGPFNGTNAVCDLEFNLTGQPGVFLGHWHSSSPFNPNLEDINNTVVDVGVEANGTYSWSLEFQCKEDETPGKGIRFAAVNFYHRKPLVDRAELQEMEARLRARGLGWIVDTREGLHLVDQQFCVDAQNYPAVDAEPAWCGQAPSELLV